MQMNILPGSHLFKMASMDETGRERFKSELLSTQIAISGMNMTTEWPSKPASTADPVHSRVLVRSVFIASHKKNSYISVGLSGIDRQPELISKGGGSFQLPFDAPSIIGHYNVILIRSWEACP